MQHTFDIRDFDADPQGTSPSTIAIQSAIDRCHEAGGGQVVCGPGIYLTGSLELKSHVELHLSAGCRLVGSPSLTDYTPLSAPGFVDKYAPERSTHSLIRAVGATNIAITGPGEIDGSGLAFYNTAAMAGRFFEKPSTPRPRMVMFYQCQNVRIEATSFIDSPCWTMWLMQCESVRVRDIRVVGDQRMINNDGINVDACRDVTISDSVFKTGDDCLVLRAIQPVYGSAAICENVTVTNCVLDSACQGVRVGCPSDGVIRNSTFSNLIIRSTGNGIVSHHPMRYFHPESERTAEIHHIMFSNIRIEATRTPILIGVDDGIALQRLSDFHFSHLQIDSGGPCRVEGCAKTPIRNVRFSDVVIRTSGDDAIVARHCTDLRLDNVSLSNRSS